MQFVAQYLKSGGKNNTSSPLPKGADELLAKIQKKIADFKAQFGPQAASDLQEGLEKIMDFMGGTESKNEIPDPKDPIASIKFLTNTAPNVNAQTSSPPVHTKPI